MDPDPYPADWTAMHKIREIEQRLEALEAKVNKPCAHVWEMSKCGVLPAVFFSGTNSFTRCVKCGHREKC